MKIIPTWIGASKLPDRPCHGVAWVGGGDGREQLMTFYPELGFIDAEGRTIEGVTYWMEIRPPIETLLD